MPIQDLVEVNIQSAVAPLRAQGFGVPLILGDSAALGGDSFRAYTSLAAMVSDGFATTDPEYVAAQTLKSQRPKKIRSWVVGQRQADVAQVQRIVITAVNSFAYHVHINGVDCTFTADGSATVGEVQAGLIAAINGSSQASLMTASSDGNDILITSDQAGIPVTVTVSANLVLSTATANVGVAESLDQIVTDGASFYTVLMTSRDAAEIYRAAVWVEAGRYLGIFQTSEANTAGVAYDAANADVGARLRAAGFQRTALIWHDDDSEYVDAAVAGKMLPETPGTESWSWKELVGVTAAELTDTQRLNLAGDPASGPGGKGVNFYYAMSQDVAMFYNGTVASREWIDVIRYIDHLQARLEVAVVNHFRNRTRVSYDDREIQALAAKVQAVLSGDKAAGILSDVIDDQGNIVTPAYLLDIPSSAEISVDDRAARVLNPGITFEAHYAGAIHHLTINGSVAP